MEQHNRVSSLWMVYLAAAIIAGGLTAFGVWLAVDRGVWSAIAPGAARRAASKPPRASGRRKARVMPSCQSLVWTNRVM